MGLSAGQEAIISREERPDSGSAAVQGGFLFPLKPKELNFVFLFFKIGADVAQASLEISNLPASASLTLGLQVCT